MPAMTVTGDPGPKRPAWLRPAAAVGLVFAAAALVVVVALVTGPAASPTTGAVTALAANPYLDPGTPLSGVAPTFTLTDQFGRAVSLRSFRGRVVVLAFNDAQCTTICPLTTTAMVEAKAMLGPAGAGMALVGVNANPTATAIRWVKAYSEAHGMLHRWQFLTGSLASMRRVWHAYHIEAAIQAGQIDHTPAVYVIDRHGHFAKLYLTQMAYAGVTQQAQILAREVSSLLPGHPRVHSTLSYDPIAPIEPTSAVGLPRAGGGTVRLATGKPRLAMFFATWLTETEDLRSQLLALDRYQSTAASRGLPSAVAVDEGSVEASPQSLPRFLAGLPRLSYPVAIDTTGRVADGYQVQDQPWFVLTSRSGQILWYWDATTQGPLSASALAAHVRAALATPPSVKLPSARDVPKVLAGAPAPLAALHEQASTLLGGGSALMARLHALHGYPVVVNVWASTCTPCRAEYHVLASASVRYGRQVAFVGVDDTDQDTAGGARGFLGSHPVSYPSYTASVAGGELASLGGVIGLPTTIFINRAGTPTKVITGQFDAEGTLDADIQSYALGA